MGEKIQALKAKMTIQAPAEELFKAFTNSTALNEWLCTGSQVEPRQGGRIYLWWNSGFYSSGEYIKAPNKERIVFSWFGRGEPWVSRVKISLKAEEDGTVVTLTHDNLGAGKEWNKAIKEIKRGWKKGLENLKSVLETGVDLRIARRPMFGFSDLAEVNPELVEQEKLDIQEGILIRGLLEGLAAHAAGLHPGDVLTKVDGIKVRGYGDLFHALDGRAAGDEIKVAYHRAGAQEKANLVLSARPLPQVPEDAQALAQELQKFNDAAQADLALSLKGIKEAEATFRPGEKEWNIRENLAHMIASERDTQSWIASLIEGYESDNPYHANETTRVSTIANSFPSVAGLVKELKLLQSETVRMLAGLPPEFVARKRSYWRLATSLLQFPNSHDFEHHKLIRELREQARASSNVPEQGSTHSVDSIPVPPMEAPEPQATDDPAPSGS